VWVELGFGGSHWRFMHELGHVIHRQHLRWRVDPEVFAERFAGCALYGGCVRLAGRISERPAFGGVR